MAISSSDGFIPSDILEGSHFKFHGDLHAINWRAIAKSITPMLNKDRIDYLLSLAGAYSLSPLILITSIQVHDDIRKASTDREFENRLWKVTEKLARAHLEHSEHEYHNKSTISVRQALQEDESKSKQFLDVYSKLHSEFDVPLSTKLHTWSKDERAVDLNNSMQWPWEAGHCWELGPSHGAAIEGLTNYIPSALDMAPRFVLSSIFNVPRGLL